MIKTGTKELQGRAKVVLHCVGMTFHEKQFLKADAMLGFI